MGSFRNKEAPFTVFTDEKNIFLKVFHLEKLKYAPANNNVEPAFPKGDIVFCRELVLSELISFGGDCRPARAEAKKNG